MLRKKQPLKKNVIRWRSHETRSQMYINLLNVMTGALSIVMTIILPTGLKGAAGYVYFLLAIVYPIFFRVRGKKSKQLFGITS